MTTLASPAGWPGRFFAPAEFACKDGPGGARGTPYPASWIGDRLVALVVDLLDPIRAAYGAALEVVSGYRTAEHNRAVRGAGRSWHLDGRAADLRPVARELGAAGAEIWRLWQLVAGLAHRKQLPRLAGLGYYPGRWIHVDDAPGGARRWIGNGVGSEQP